MDDLYAQPAAKRLSVMERLALLDLLPKEGNFLTLSAADEVRRLVEFSIDEQAKLQLRNNESGMSWEATADDGLELTLTEAQRAVVVETLQARDKARTLKDFHLPLYRRFVVGLGA